MALLVWIMGVRKDGCVTEALHDERRGHGERRQMRCASAGLDAGRGGEYRTSVATWTS
jgi:hypothetical protein